MFLILVISIIALVSPLSSVLAANCDISPLLIPVQERNHTNAVHLQLGKQEFYLGVSTVQNDIVLPGLNLSESCAVGLPGLGIELSCRFVNSLPNYVGLGLESTLINDLYNGNHIPSRSYGLSYGLSYDATRKNSSLQVESLVLGGYDKSRVRGEFYAGIVSSSLDVEVDSITVTLPDGTTERLLDNGYKFNASIDNTFDELVFPLSIAEAYRRAVDGELVNASDFIEPRTFEPHISNKLWSHKTPFNGSLTIRLSNGLEATIPSELLSHPQQNRKSQTEYISTILGHVGNEKSGVFGAVFLSQVYLSVDYESMKFSLANRAGGVGKNAELDKIGCGTDSSVEDEPNPVATSTSKPRSSTNKILGPTLGSLLGAIAVLTLALFLLKRYKRRRVTNFSPRRGGDTKGVGYRRHSEAALGFRPSLIDVEAARVEKVAQFPQFPSTPSRVSIAPSRGDTPARNSYFTEELDISRGREL